jgi:hypothetical protein
LTENKDLAAVKRNDAAPRFREILCFVEKSPMQDTLQNLAEWRNGIRLKQSQRGFIASRPIPAVPFDDTAKDAMTALDQENVVLVADKLVPIATL